MSIYKSIKITFDLEDEYQLKLYNYVKQRSNGSSYIRTLIHQDLHANSNVQIQDKEYEVVKEQVEQVSVSSPIRINSYQDIDKSEDEDTVFIDDLI